MKLETLVLGILMIIIVIVGAYFFMPAPKADDLGISTEVKISNSEFSPSNLTIKAGTTVVWVNQGTIPHILKADKGEFMSDTLKSGERFAYTFRTKGTFQYTDTIYKTLKGTVIVE